MRSSSASSDRSPHSGAVVWLCLVAPLGSCLAVGGWAQASPEAAAVQPIPMLFDEQRPQGQDLLILRGGDNERVVGDLLDESLSIQTPYARVTLPLSRVAGIDMGNPDDADDLFDSLIAVNGDQFSGILLSPTLRFRLRGGGEIPIRREAVDRVFVRLRPEETKGIPLRQHFVLQSGDHFSGLLEIDAPLSLSTPYAELALDLAKVQSIEFPEPGGAAEVHWTTGTVARGTLNLTDLDIELDATVGLAQGPTRFDLYSGRLKTILCQQGAAANQGLLAELLTSELRIPDAQRLPTDGSHVTADLDQSQIDSYHFAATQGTTYTLETANMNQADTVLELLDVDGQTQLMRDDDSGTNGGSRITWTCPRTGVYYARVWMFGGGPQFLQQFPNGVLPPGFNANLPAGTYEIWAQASPTAAGDPVPSPAGVLAPLVDLL